MKINNRNLALLALTGLIFINTGCSRLKNDNDPLLNLNSNKKAQSTYKAKRFEDAAPNNQTAVDSAIELTRRLEKFTQELTETQRRSQKLAEENRKFKERLSVVEPELKQAKKELAQANDLLIEMRVELNNWKANILGYREEMREANKAQMQALLKILKVLGGETKTVEKNNN
ncbi:MAG: hypothetical protein K8R02_04455 [Anaerohalosphaeraceae bacterium]|nr:hypothetical protein [Anaerohalosphaeraceae bacterium]